MSSCWSNTAMASAASTRSSRSPASTSAVAIGSPPSVSPVPTLIPRSDHHVSSVILSSSAIPGRPCCQPGAATDLRARGRFEHALGAAAPADPELGPRAGGEDHRGDHHHHHGAEPRLRRHLGRLPPADPDRLRHLDRLCRVELLPDLLLLQRGGAGVMSTPSLVAFEIPLHRALTEPILLGGAPRARAIVNGAAAAAVAIGLQLWLAGLAFWAIGHA